MSDDVDWDKYVLRNPHDDDPTDRLAVAAGDLIAEAVALKTLGGSVVHSDDIGSYAVELAINGWAIFPLKAGSRSKTPASVHGVLDATSDLVQVIAWWSGPYRGRNIGGRVPKSLFVLDIDPRKEGCERGLLELQEENGWLPDTLTMLSGRGDGGRHYYFKHPGGELSQARLPDGCDIKTSAGYCVLPPSIHPDSGQPYSWLDERAPVSAPGWLVDLLRPRSAVSAGVGGVLSSRCPVG